MTTRASPSRKVFTAQQANAALPLVRAIVRDVVHLAREVAERRQRVTALSAGRAGRPKDVYAEELAQAEEELQRDIEQLQQYAAELEALGVELKSPTEGLVDFPTVIEGRPAYLCWKYGEPEVRYWHELDAGFAGRRPLPLAGGEARPGRRAEPSR